MRCGFVPQYWEALPRNFPNGEEDRHAHRSLEEGRIQGDGVCERHCQVRPSIRFRYRGTTTELLRRIHAQFDHIGETYLAGFDFDLGERELGYALSFDHDLDMFAASLGLVKTSIEAVMKEDGKFGIAVVTSSRFNAARCTRRDVGDGRFRPRRNFIRSSEEGLGPV